MAPVIAAYEAMRGVSFILAATFVAEIGDVRRFDNPRQLMSFLGLVPSERSTGETVRRAGLTLAGNRRARRVLVEGAWTYRYPARISETLRARLQGVAKGRPRHRLEGAGPALRPISPAGCRRQENTCRRRRDRPRNGCLSLGQQPSGRTADLNRINRTRLEMEHGGEPLARLRGRALPDARLLDAGKAPRRNTHGGSQPRIEIAQMANDLAGAQRTREPLLEAACRGLGAFSE